MKQIIVSCVHITSRAYADAVEVVFQDVLDVYTFTTVYAKPLELDPASVETMETLVQSTPECARSVEQLRDLCLLPSGNVVFPLGLVALLRKLGELPTMDRSFARHVTVLGTLGKYHNPGNAPYFVQCICSLVDRLVKETLSASGGGRTSATIEAISLLKTVP